MGRLLVFLGIGGMFWLVGCGSSAPPLPTATPTEPAATVTPLPTATTTPVLTSGSQEIVHIVQPGDTLFKLAETYKTTVGAIQLANNLKDPNLIVVGQRLTIPTKGP